MKRRPIVDQHRWTATPMRTESARDILQALIRIYARSSSTPNATVRRHAGR